jgi:hypothetical protein
MKAAVPLKLSPDLAMALDTAKGGRLGGNLMTLDAVGVAAQALVSAGERPGRNLRARGTGAA